MLLVHRFNFFFFPREVPGAPQKNMCLIVCPTVTAEARHTVLFAKSYFVDLFTSVMVIHTELELKHLPISSLNTTVPKHYSLGDSHSLVMHPGSLENA